MSLKLLQLMAGVTPDGVFGPNTFHAAKEFLDIPTDIAAVHFFAQCAHETGEFRHFEENLNYSKDGLLATWPSRYTEELAEKHHRNPELIANHVYARAELGNTEPGDGWKYRGRGAIQLTGKHNYERFAEYINDPSIVTDPNKVSKEYSFIAAMWFFHRNGIFDVCTDFKQKTVKEITKKINGGYNGLDHRIKLTSKYEKLL